jgi:protocatechuate 3,4-dioxygenase beta subunit
MSTKDRTLQNPSSRRALAVLFAAFACAATVTIEAQQQITIETTAAPGDPVMFPGLAQRGQFKTGTGRITGRVVSSDTGMPVRRAQVRLTAPEIGSKTSLTDAEGRFEFRDLPAARFTMNASKSGYATVQYGQTRPFESGRPIELADNQALDKADIAMPRGGVISGRILDEFGEPVADAMVSAMRQTWAGGRRRLVPSGRIAQTNDLGQFRMYGLPPGEYYVSATLRNAEPMMLEGAFGAAGGTTASGSQPASGYAPTYYPGTTAASGAGRVTVAIGQEVLNTDFALAPVRLARISGTVLTSDGKPLEGAIVSAVPANRSGEVLPGMMGTTGRTSRDGAFSINGVAPGEYTLTVRSMRIFMSDGGDTVTFRGTIGGPEAAESESAAFPVTVSGEDLSSVVIITSKGGTAAGQLTFEGSVKPPSAASVRIMATSPDIDGPGMGSSATTVKADGGFELRGLSGRRVLRPGGLPPGWMLKSVRFNGEDVTDTGIEFRPGQETAGIEIVATSQATEISGTVTAANGTPIRDYTVIVFADDAQLWSLPMSRWVTGMRPDQDGRFRIRSMPPGSYHAVAVDYVEQGAWGDPELLERLKAHGKRFTLAEGGREVLDLRLAEQY